MKSGLTRKKLNIGGMTCVNCQNKIEKKLCATPGIESAEVSYNAGTAVVAYDSGIISLRDIAAIIRKLDYDVLTASPQKPESNITRAAGAVLIIVTMYIVMQRIGLTQVTGNFQLADSGMGYGMLFIIGLVTSVHCVAMCGGINLSQCIPASAPDKGGSKLAVLRPTFLYNLGRVISYTIVGGIIGALGSAFALPGGFKGIVQIIAGVFMVIMGVNMLGIFPWLRKFSPRMPKLFANKINAEKGKSKSPLYIGLLNGLMPCGPLQAMQLYALSTGNPAAGALSMMLFSLGTVPLMFGLGALSSILSKKFTSKMMTAGAILVVVLGLSMFSQGWSLSGFSGLPLNTSDSDNAQGIVIEDGFQVINSTLESGRYPAITVQAGIPVRWTINSPQGSVNGCNNRMFIPEYGIEYKFQTGENVIEFTPEKSGIFRYSCWMGMIRSSITVIGEDGSVPQGGNNDNADVSPPEGCCN